MKENKNSSNEENNIAAMSVESSVTSHVSQDLRNAVLITSLILNLFIFTAWLAVQVTSQYDAQVASFLFN